MKLGARGIAAFALLTASVLAVEIVLSRLFAVTLGYYYAFMLISLAMLGLASGALIVQRWSAALDTSRLASYAFWLSNASGAALLVASLLMLAEYPLVLRSWPAALFLLFLTFTPYFVLTGTVIALVLCHSGDSFRRLYAVDLMSASAGCLVAIALLSAMSPMIALIACLSPLSFLAASLFASEERRPRRMRYAAYAGMMCLTLGLGSQRIRQIANPPRYDWLGRKSVLVKWNSFSSVWVYPGDFFTWALSGTYRGQKLPMLCFMIDGIGGTQIVKFDGRLKSLRGLNYLDHDLTALGQSLIPAPGRRLVIGPGGGVDILQGVRAGATDLTAVEINPLVVSAVNQDLVAFSGAPYRLPGVHLFVENGRTFLERTRETWDLISLTWVDTGGSAVALAATENYLYTVEAYRSYLRHLTKDGSLAFMRALGATGYRGPDWPIDTLRGISIAVEALRQEGVRDPGSHIVIAASDSPYFYHRGMCYVLVKKSPFTSRELEQVVSFVEGSGFEVLWTPDQSAVHTTRRYSDIRRIINDLIRTTEPSRVYADSFVDVRPSTDDNPFYFVERGGRNRPAGPAINLLGICTAILGLLVLVAIGVPLVNPRSDLRMRSHHMPFILYCASVGIGFMIIEIEFLHVFGILLGNPTYTLAVVLATLLVGSGLGSLLSERLVRQPAHLVTALIALVVCVVLLASYRAEFVQHWVSGAMWERVAVVAVTVLIPSVLMGLPLASGMRLAGFDPAVRAWGWAINGAASILASVGALVMAIYIGLAATLMFGAACYLVAAGLFVAMSRTFQAPVTIR